MNQTSAGIEPVGASAPPRGLGITRGKKLVVLIGQRKALAMAVKNNKTESRFTGLLARLTTPAE